MIKALAKSGFLHATKNQIINRGAKSIKALALTYTIRDTDLKHRLLVLPAHVPGSAGGVEGPAAHHRGQRRRRAHRTVERSAVLQVLGVRRVRIRVERTSEMEEKIVPKNC